MRLEWTRGALRSLDGIADRIAQDSPLAARRMVRKIEQAVIQLAGYPSLGRAGRVTGTRELIVAGTPFIVPYRVREGSLEILAIFHAARNWPEEF